MLTSAAFQPFIAALSDIFGRQPFVLMSLILFTVGSILCGVSQNFTQLLAGRVIQGIGGGGIITLSQVITADIVPLRQRPKYFSIVLLGWAIGTIFGPLVGGAFDQNATWRWCFFINLPFCGIGFPMVYFFLRFEPDHSSLRSRLATVDWIGGLLFISSLTSFLISISWGGVLYAWSSSHTLVPLIIGLFGLAATIIWEALCKHPFLQKSLFRSRAMITAYLCALFLGLLLFMTLYYLAFYFTAVHFHSPIHSGVDLLPCSVFVVPGSIIVSALITRMATFHWSVRIGSSITTLSCGLLIVFNSTTPTAVSATLMSIEGLGLGIVLTSVNFAIQAICPNTEHAGQAAALYAFMRSLGMCLGVAVGGTVFQNLMRQRLLDLDLPEQIAKNAESYVSYLHTLHPDDPHRSAVLECYVHGFRGVFAVMTAIAGSALIFSFAIRHHDMDRILVTKHRLSKNFG